jgi:hypothetical protein
MMFGAMGNTDHAESVRMIHTALKGRRDDVFAGNEVRLARGA